MAQFLNNPRSFQWGVKSGDCVCQGAIKYPVYRGMSEHDVEHSVALSCKKWGLAGLARRDTTIGCKVWEMYLSAFKLKSIRTRYVHCACRVSNGFSIHHTRHRSLYTDVDASRRQSLSSESSDTCTAIRLLHTEQRLVWKNDDVPFRYPSLSFGRLNRLLALCCIVKKSRWNGRHFWQATLLQKSVSE